MIKRFNFFRKIKKLIAVIVILSLLSAIVQGCSCKRWASEKVGEILENEFGDIDYEKIEDSENNQDTLKIHFLDVGQGDCTLITCGNEAMLIDAGDNDKGSLIKNYIEKQGISKLKYVIGTHPDADHIGGLDVIIYNFDCENIFLSEYIKNTKTYDDVMQTINQKNYKYSCPNQGDTFNLGMAQFTIITDKNLDYGDNANNYSIGIKLVHGTNSFIFTGDCEEEAEQNILNSNTDVSATVFKAGHHGSSTANTYDFLKAVSPEYVIISCEENNSYGHPHAEVMNNFREMGFNVFRTDEQGTIVCISDGKEIQWNCSPSDSWLIGTNTLNQSTNTVKRSNI